MQRQVAVVGKLYTGKDKDGDFKWMIKQKQYDDTDLNLFNNAGQKPIAVLLEGVLHCEGQDKE